MTEHEVAEILGAHIVLSGREAETWHSVAKGRLTPYAAAARLLSAREQTDPLVHEEIERAAKIFAPVTGARTDERFSELLSRMDADRPAKTTSVAGSSSSKGSMRWFMGLFAVAAAVMLLLGLPRNPSSDPTTFSAGYELKFDKLPVSMRGTSPQPREVPRLLVDGRLNIWLRPEHAVKLPIGVVAFSRHSSGTTRMLAIDPRVEELGSIEIDTTVRALNLTEGRWELVFAIGPPATLPTSWEALADEGETKVYEVVRANVEITLEL